MIVRNILLFIISCLLCSPLYSQSEQNEKNIYASYKNGLWGAQNSDADLIIPYVYDTVHIDNMNFAHVYTDTLQGIRDHSGEMILPVNFQFIYSTNSKRFITRLGNIVTLFDKDGKVLYEGDSIEIAEVNDQYFIINEYGKDFLFNARTKEKGDYFNEIVCSDPNRNIFILSDETGQFIYMPDKAYKSEVHTKIIKQNKELYFLNRVQEKKVLTIIDKIEIRKTDKFFYHNLTDSTYAYSINGAIIIRDSVNNESYSFLADSISDFFQLGKKNTNRYTMAGYFDFENTGYFAYIYNDTLMGIIDHTYESISQVEFSDISSYKERYFKIKKAGKTGLMSKEGKIIIPTLYNKITLHRGFFYVHSDEGTGVFDGSKQILESKYTDLYHQGNGYFIYYQDDKAGIVKSGDRIICDADYSNIIQTKNSFILERKNEEGSQFGLMSKLGRIIVPLKYESISKLDSSYLKIVQEKDGKLKCGVITDRGKKIIAPVFQNVYPTFSENIFKVRGFTHRKLSVAQINRIKKTEIPLPLDDRPTTRFLTGYVNVFGQILIDTLYWEPQINNDYDNLMFEVRYDTVFMVVTYENDGRLYDKTVYNNYIRVNETKSVEKTFHWKLKPVSENKRRYGLYFGTIRVLPHEYDRYNDSFGDDFNAVFIRQEGENRQGMVDMRRGKLVLPPIYKEFSQNDLNIYNFNALENVYGRFAIIDKNYVPVKKGLGYVDDYTDGFARLNVGGKKTELETDSRDYFKMLPYSIEPQNMLDYSYYYVNGGKWGVVDTLLNQTVQARYDFIHDYHCGGFIAERKGKWGKIDPHDKIQIQFIYDEIQSFGKLYPANIDTNELHMIRDFPYYKAKKDRAWGVIDTAGNVIVPFEFSKIELAIDSAYTGFITIRRNKKNLYGFIDEKGKQMCLPRFVKTEAFKNGFARVQLKHKEWVFIDEEMNILPGGPYKDAQDFSDGMAAVKVKTLWGFIDESGTFVIDPQYKSAGSFGNGLAPVYTKTEYTEKGRTQKKYAYIYINKKNEKAIQDLYSKASNFKFGKAIVQKDGKYGLIDTKGNKKTSFSLNQLSRFKEHDLYKAKKGKNKITIISGNGKKILPFKDYSHIGEFSNGLCPVKKGNQAFYIDTLGNKSIVLNALRLGDFKYGKALVFKKRSYEYIDTLGNTICKTDFLNKKYNYYYLNDEDSIINPENQIADSVYYFYQPRTFYAKTNLRLVNAQSEPIVISDVQAVSEFYEGFASYGVNTTYGIYDIIGEQKADNGYIRIEEIEPGLFKLTSLNVIRYLKLE
jgi:hypothetical protein